MVEERERLEREKLQVEIQKIMAECVKLNAETVKITKESVWYPFAAGAGLVTAVVALLAGILKFFG